MFEIKNNVIEITKGDSARLHVSLAGADGSIYTMQDGDTLTMTVRKKPNNPVILSLTSETDVINLTPAQTKNLSPGKCCYDIELRTADGFVFTVIGIDSKFVDGNMIVYPEITE